MRIIRELGAEIEEVRNFREGRAGRAGEADGRKREEREERRGGKRGEGAELGELGGTNTRNDSRAMQHLSITLLVRFERAVEKCGKSWRGDFGVEWEIDRSRRVRLATEGLSASMRGCVCRSNSTRRSSSCVASRGVAPVL